MRRNALNTGFFVSSYEMKHPEEKYHVFSTREINLKDLVLLNITRLILSIPVVYLITILFNITDIAQNTLIVMAAMPTAVFTVLLATEFGTKGQYVANSVITSTLLSMITLTILIYYLTT